MRRKPDSLLPLEVGILQTGVELRMRGVEQFHGYLLAREMKDREGAKLLTGHGTLYKALGRLAKRGLLESSWEDSAVAAAEERPRRRLYEVTPLGQQALEAAERAMRAPRLNPGAQPA